MKTPTMRSSGHSENSRVATEYELELVPVTWTLCFRRSGERALLLSAVGIWELYATPLSSFPVTSPVELIVAVETLFAVTSLTKPL